MRKKNIYILFTVCFLAFVLTACGGKDKYAPVKALLQKQADVMDTTRAKLEKAVSAPEVSEAINYFASEMEKLVPVIQENSSLLDEINKMSSPPDEVKALNDKMEEATQKMIASTSKINEFAGDPEVQKAQKRLSEVMSMMEKGGVDKN